MFAQIDAHNTVGQLILDRPARARVLDRFGIEYSRNSDKPLEDLCREKALDVKSVLYDLREADATTADTNNDWRHAPLGALVDEIISSHHLYLRRELPAIAYLMDRVADANRVIHPELLELKAVFGEFRTEVEKHMDKEEKMLFPLCRQSNQPGIGMKPARAGRISYLINSLERDHEAVIEILAQMRFLTDGYRCPSDCGNTCGVLMDGLADLESDMLEHIRLESDILFPRAKEIEASIPVAAVKTRS